MNRKPMWYVFDVHDAGGDGPNDTLWGRVKVRAMSRLRAIEGEVEPRGSLVRPYRLRLVSETEEEPA